MQDLCSPTSSTIQCFKKRSLKIVSVLVHTATGTTDKGLFGIALPGPLGMCAKRPHVHMRMSTQTKNIHIGKGRTYTIAYCTYSTVPEGGLRPRFTRICVTLNKASPTLRKRAHTFILTGVYSSSCWRKWTASDVGIALPYSFKRFTERGQTSIAK